MWNTSVLNGSLSVRLQVGALLLTMGVLAGLELGLAREILVQLPLLVACVVSGIALLGARRLRRTLAAAEAERERIEQALRRSEEYHKVFRHTSDALLIVDAEDLRVCDANERACLIYRSPARAARGAFAPRHAARRPQAGGRDPAAAHGGWHRRVRDGAYLYG
jgi:PAS domain-containing protein